MGTEVGELDAYINGAKRCVKGHISHQEKANAPTWLLASTRYRPARGASPLAKFVPTGHRTAAWTGCTARACPTIITASAEGDTRRAVRAAYGASSPLQPPEPMNAYIHRDRAVRRTTRRDQIRRDQIQRAPRDRSAPDTKTPSAQKHEAPDEQRRDAQGELCAGPSTLCRAR